MKLKNIVVLVTFLINFLHAEPLQKVSVQLLWKNQFEFAGFYMAKEKGFYKDAGLDVDLKEYSFGLNITKEVLSGKSTFGVGYTDIILDKSNGSDIILLNAIFQSSPHVFIALKSSGINSIKDFKNKKVMIESDAIKTAPLLSMLYSKGITLKDMKPQPPSFNIQDLIQGKTDIFSAYLSNEVYKLNDMNIAYNIFNPKDYGFDFYNDLLFTSNKTLKQNPKLVNNFQKATIDGWNYAFSHIDETIQIILNKYNSLHKTREALEYEAQVLKKLAYADNKYFGEITKEKIQRIYDVYNLMGEVKHKINFDNFIYNTDRSNSFLTADETEYLQKHKIIKMCNNPNWEPLEFLDDNKMQGIVIDNMHLIEQKLGVKFEHIPTDNWIQSQQFLKDKKCDILPAAIKTKKREKYALFTEPYLDYKLAIITKNDKMLIDDIKDIIDKPIARKEGSGLISKLKADYPNVNIIETKDYLESLYLVSNGAAYSTIATLPIASYYINKFAINNLYIAGYTKMRYKLSIAVRDDKQILCSILDKALLSITADEKHTIDNKWLNVSINEAGFDYKVLLKIAIFILILVVFFLYRQNLLERVNQNLEQIVEEKTKTLNQLNQDLEKKVEKTVNEIRQKDKILYDQAKMASMGEMIGNIAHQWRQPLSLISTIASGMAVKIEHNMFDETEAKNDLTTLVNTTQYLSNTIDDFQNFLKPTQQLVHFDIKDTISKELKMFGKTFLDNNIEVIVNTKDMVILGNENELLQVIINILNNAKDAFKDKDIKQKYVFIDLYKENENAIISIKDNAGGFDEKILPNIFDAYFTTKHKYQGTGLGLYMSYQIVTNKFHGTLKAQNSTFTYKNESYIGAQFIISLKI